MKVSISVGKIELDFEEVEEKQCHKCGEWWPATEEFFYRRSDRPDKWVSPCKACQWEQKRQHNLIAPCCVPGCNKPRYNDHSSRCYEHKYRAKRKG